MEESRKPDRPAATLPPGMILARDEDGLFLQYGEQLLRGDFSRMLPRLRPEKLGGELIVRAARGRGGAEALHVLDATAGLGEDSFLLAAAGCTVTLYEHNPVIFSLLEDALDRAKRIEALAPIAARMQLHFADSVEAMRRLSDPPDVILLDPMFPERQKSALVKKKLQMLQMLEIPCPAEEELWQAAVSAAPRKLIVKRPPKGPYLAGQRPDYSIAGKAVRFDCFASPAHNNRR